MLKRLYKIVKSVNDILKLLVELLKITKELKKYIDEFITQTLPIIEYMGYKIEILL